MTFVLKSVSPFPPISIQVTNSYTGAQARTTQVSLMFCLSHSACYSQSTTKYSHAECSLFLPCVNRFSKNFRFFVNINYILCTFFKIGLYVTCSVFCNGNTPYLFLIRICMVLFLLQNFPYFCQLLFSLVTLFHYSFFDLLNIISDVWFHIFLKSFCQKPSFVPRIKLLLEFPLWVKWVKNPIAVAWVAVEVHVQSLAWELSYATGGAI